MAFGLRAFAVCVVLTGSVAFSAKADIYQYTDRQGVTHFTNVPRGAGWKRIIEASRSRGRRPMAPAHPLRTLRPPATREDYDRYLAHARDAARFYQLPDAFVKAIMVVESNYHPEVVSNAGAMGLMQLMPGTAARMGVRDPFDPRENIFGGVRYLRVLANMFNGDLVLTIAAYNAGENAVIRYRGIPPYDETRRYVQRVLRHYYYFRSGGGGRSAAVARNP